MSDNHYEITENTDYVSLPKNGEKIGRPKIEYYVTLNIN